MAAQAAPTAQAVPTVATPYVFLLGDDEVGEGIIEEDSLLQILHWIGFCTTAHRQSMVTDSFTSWEDLKMLAQEDADTMSKTFASRSQTNGRIIFGTNRTKYVKATIHWIQDFYRVSDDLLIVGLRERTFKSELQRALSRAIIRKNLSSQTSSVADAASPGPLIKESQWKEWEEKFSYTKAHIGAAGIPLSYVIREDDDPDNDTDHPDFVSCMIACGPLEGEF